MDDPKELRDGGARDRYELEHLARKYGLLPRLAKTSPAERPLQPPCVVSPTQPSGKTGTRRY
jgi:hypothetical protein